MSRIGPTAEIDRFSRHGQYLSTLKLPLGAFPCDVDYLDNLGIVGALHGADRAAGAPIYILEDDKLVSTIMPKGPISVSRTSSTCITPFCTRSTESST